MQLIAGTAWLFAKEDMDQTLDYLFIDEAGQVSLADALAVGTAARNLVLLGDPLQLAQVSQGVHPGDAGARCSSTCSATSATIPPERGLFLDHTRRMHPDVCGFISEVVYAGRLELDRGVRAPVGRVDGGLTGTGLRYLPVEHEGNTRSSPEEADVIAEAIAELLDGGRFTDQDGATAPARRSNDILVVTPYNAQVGACASGCRTARASAPSTSSRARRRRSSSSRWRPRAARRSRATSSSCSAATG